MAKKHQKTKEHLLAEKVIDLLSDIRLDLDMIGLYFGRYARTVIYNRLQHIAEVAKHTQEKDQDLEAHYEYIRNINS